MIFISPVNSSNLIQGVPKDDPASFSGFTLAWHYSGGVRFESLPSDSRFGQRVEVGHSVAIV